MTSEQLGFLQHMMGGVMLALLAIAALILVLGLVRPSWVRAQTRWRAVGRALSAGLLGIVLYAGTIAYTHSHPEGPHAVKGYIEDYFAEQCAKGADLPGCKDAAGAQP